MKKKSVAALILAAALAAQPMCVFAASSSSSDDGGTTTTTTTNTSSTKSDTTVSVTSTGVKTTGATTSADPKGTTIGVVVETTTTTGQQVTVNSKGEAVVGDVAIAFAKDQGSATAGLPENVVSAINDINSGKALSEVVKDVDVSGYNALTGTHAIITKDAATGAIKDTPTEVSLYVPNLVEGLATVEVLFYNNVTGQWTLLPAVKVDPVTKTVAVNIPGSGTLSVVYKK